MQSNARLKIYRGTWNAVWRENGRTRRRSMKTKDRKEARRHFEDWKRKAPGKLVSDAWSTYIADKAKTATDPNRMRDAWKAAGPFFGHLRPDQVTRELCREYASNRRRFGIGNGTIRRELGTVRSAIFFVNKQSGAIFELPPAPPPRDRALSKEEYANLFASAKTPHIRLFIILALATAGRASAILELTWDRIDFSRRLIKLSVHAAETRRKGRATVPMTEAAFNALREAAENAECDYVISYGGKRVRSIKRGFARAATLAGLEGVTPHVLRHTAAVWMAEAGRPMSEIAQYLGHSSSRITEQVYARYSPQYLKGAAAALEV